eukprot:COSAG05_NODE_2764_length_2670_cov_3.347779_1_plen_151_part_00
MRAQTAVPGRTPGLTYTAWKQPARELTSSARRSPTPASTPPATGIRSPDKKDLYAKYSELRRNPHLAADNGLERLPLGASPIYTQPLLSPRGGELPYSTWRQQRETADSDDPTAQVPSPLHFRYTAIHTYQLQWSLGGNGPNPNISRSCA